MTVRSSRSWHRALFAFLSFLVILGIFLPQHVSAQGILIDSGFHYPLPRPIFPPPRPEPRPEIPAPLNYTIEALEIDADIADSVANVNFTQTFKNEGTSTIEASFVFPLPYDGAIDSMTLLVNGKEFAAKLLDAKEARKTYQEIVRKNRDPALLEWIGTGMFKTNVFPIPAGEKCVVSITYTQLLRTSAGLTEFLFPLSCAKYSTKPVEKTAFRINIKGDEEIKNVYSPTCEIKTERPDKNSAVVTYEFRDRVPSGDFRLFFDRADGDLAAKIQSYRPNADEDGYFMLLAAPKIVDKNAEDALSKTIVLTLDVSGSMSGEKIEQARESLKYVLERLRDGDRFNIVRFNTLASAFAEELQVCNAEARAKALAFANSVRASGATNIEDALKTSFALLASDDSTNPKYLVFLSDGEPTAEECNEMKLAQIARNENKSNARIFTFGVGYDVHSRLLDRFAADSKGQGQYVRPDENIEDAVSKLYNHIESPIFTNVKFEFALKNHPDVQYFTNLVYPSGPVDVFAGEQIALVGRYAKSGDIKIAASGKIGKEEVRFEFEGSLTEKSLDSSYAYIERLWAVRRVGEIVDQLDLQGKNKELLDELLLLAKKHGILTPYTSFLADDAVPLNAMEANAQVVRSKIDMLGDNASGSLGFAQRSLKQNYMGAKSLDQTQNESVQESMAMSSNASSASAMSGSISRKGSMSGSLKNLSRAFMSGPALGAPKSVPEPQNANGALPQQNAVKNIGAKTFYFKQGEWVDSDIDEKVEKELTPIEIKQFSDEYFALEEREGQELAQYLTFSEPTRVYYNGKVYRIAAE